MGNQTLGRGELWFSLFSTGTETPSGFRFLGNAPEFNLTIENQMLDHFSSTSGIREKDKSIVLETTSTGSCVLDDIMLENLALFFFGSTDLVVQPSASAQTESFVVVAGQSYQIGLSDDFPTGLRSLTSVVVTAPTAASGNVTFTANPAADDTVTVNGTVFTAKASGATGNQFNIGADVTATALNLANVLNASVVAGVALATYSPALGVVTVTYDTGGTAGNAFTLAKSGTNITVSGATLSGGSASGATTLDTDYTLDAELGIIGVIDGGSIVTGETMNVAYSQSAVSRTQVISGTDQIEGAMRFISYNPEGTKMDYYMPKVKLSPNGDFGLISDEWQQLSLNVEILKGTGRQRLYIDGRPA